MLPVYYRIPAKKFFKKLNNKTLKNKFEEAIKELRNDPEIGEKKVGDLSGIWGYDVYYNNINYEIAYIIEPLEEGKLLVIIMAGTRDNFWNEVKRYMN